MNETIFLRFPDEATFTALLPADFARAGETGGPLPQGLTAISIIGSIYTGGVWDEDGSVVTPPTLVPGFHVNALGELPPEWESYVLTPAPGSPVRVFGGTA
jgi:hypothetical protein